MDIKQFLVEIEQFERTLNSAYNEIDSSVVDSLENEISGLRDSLRDIESTISDWSDTLDNVRDEFNALKEMVNDIEANDSAEQTQFVPTYGREEINGVLRVWSLMAERLSHANFHETMLKNPALFWHASAIFMVTNAPSKTFRLAEYIKDNYDNAVNH